MAEIPVESLIREAATSRGVDPDLAVKIAQKESSLYPKAKNPRSSAYGLFQITNDTWKEYGGTPENRYDMMDNIRIGMDIIASNRDTFLKKFGRAPNAGELYTMHMMGKTGGPRLMSQDPTALMADVVSPKIIKANRIPSTQTVGEFIASMQQKMGSKVDTMMAKRGATEQKAGTVPTPKAPKETIKERPVREPIIPLAEGEMRKRPLPDQRLLPLAQGEMSQDMIASLGPNYQAALGAMALGDTSEDDLDFDNDEALGDRYQRYVAEQDRIRLREMEDAQEESRPTALASLDLSYQSPFEQSPFEEEQPQAPVMLARGGVVHRRDGSPMYGEMVPDSGPVTEDTRKALSTRQGLSAAEMMRMLKGVGSEGVSNLESVVRGQEAMLLGSPGDIESIFRSDEKRIFPTSDEVLKKFLPRVTSPTREAEGFEAVGMYVPPPIPSSAFSTGAELIKQGANKVSSTAKNLLPKKQVIPEDLFPTRKLSSQELLKQLKEVDPAALERGKQAFLKDSAEKRRMYHGTRHSVGLPDIQVLEDGTIKQVYSDRHGFSEFKPRTADMTFLSPDPSFSETFAGMYKHASGEKYLPHGGTMYPVYAKVKKPFDYENLEHVKELADEVIRLGKKKSPNLANLYKTDPDFPFWATRKDYAIDALSDGSWATLENPIVIQAIKNLKYDGVYMKESGVKNLGVFDPKNIKSATGNIGTYDAKKPDIRKAHGGVVHRKDGSPIYGEVADSGPITEDTRIALSLPQGLSSAELLKLFKNVGKEGVSNLESLARGSVAAVPGLVGDIESIFRSDKERKFATTPEVERQYLPSRLTKPTKESAGFIEAGTFIDPTVGLKVAKPVAKGTAKAALAGFKSVSPQLEDILEKSAFGLDKMYIVKPTGGTTYPASMVSKIDDYLNRLRISSVPGIEGLKGKDAKKISEFITTKGRDYLTKRYGSPQDAVKEAILDGRVTLTGADAELFPPRLLAEAREGNPVALERFEEIYDKNTGLQGTVVFDNLADPKAKVAKEKEWEKLIKEGALPHEINLNVVGVGRKDLGYGYGSDAETELRKFLSAEKIPPKEASGVMYAARHGEPIYDLDSMYPRFEFLEPNTVVPALVSVVDDLDRMSFPEALIRGMQKTDVLRNENAAIERAAQGKSVPVELFQRGIEPIAQVGDFSLVRVKSPFAVRMEGAAMRHSIGNYALDPSYGLGGKKAFESGETQVFSIRNAEGRPVVSMDALISESGYPVIGEIRSIFNSEPNEQEKQAIFKAFDTLLAPHFGKNPKWGWLGILPTNKYKNARDGNILALENRAEVDWWQEYTNYLRKKDAN